MFRRDPLRKADSSVMKQNSRHSYDGERAHPDLMILRKTALLSLLFLAACAEPSTRLTDLSAGRCLYATQDGSSRGRQTKWASCSSPPPLAIGLINGGSSLNRVMARMSDERP
jgi:hypothetical protein